ncbi:MAG: SSI family serine proteinase inhibitor [Sporichthyaceae bacterium]
MRFANAALAAAAVVAGFTGSLTAAHALSVPDPLDVLALPGVSEQPRSTDTGGTSLTVRYNAGDGARPVVMSLTCDPTGGDHPRAPQACDSLAAAATAGEDPFAAPPRDQVCTDNFGGPQRASVVGTWNGDAVDAKFSRTNGCAIARWDAIEPVLSPVPPA